MELCSFVPLGCNIFVHLTFIDNDRFHVSEISSFVPTWSLYHNTDHDCYAPSVLHVLVAIHSIDLMATCPIRCGPNLLLLCPYVWSCVCYELL